MSLTPLPKNAHRLTIAQVAHHAGYADPILFLERTVQGPELTTLACCDCWCEVPLDGWCSHGNPSPLLAGGFI